MSQPSLFQSCQNWRSYFLRMKEAYANRDWSVNAGPNGLDAASKRKMDRAVQFCDGIFGGSVVAVLAVLRSFTQKVGKRLGIGTWDCVVLFSLSC